VSGASDPSPVLLECSVCGLPLERSDRTLSCTAGHSFDVAREGYVNLLTPKHKTRGIEGDTARMLQARHRFLEGGHYRPLLDLLAEKVSAALVASASDSRVVLEVGCGEGYYIGGIAGVLARKGGGGAFAGMDVSKAAAKIAAKRHPDVLFFVGDVNRRVYLPDHSVDVLLDVFAPRNPAEFVRVLRREGTLLVVIPGEPHLASARSALGLLDIQEEKEAKVLARLEGTFRLADRSELHYDLSLSPSEVADLVAMGPNQWHRKTPGVGETLEPMVTEASFIVLTLVPNW
jgi:23S rRNA (guanine745-N1)-methyltransferase